MKLPDDRKLGARRALTTMLFVPGNAERRFEKIPQLGARAYILDLEDAVPDNQKEAGRRLVAELITRQGSSSQFHVRVNPVDTDHFILDLEAVVISGLAGIVLPKTTTSSDVICAAKLIDHLERRAKMSPGTIELMATIETVEGLNNVLDIARCRGRLRRLGFGAGDFTLDLGVEWAPNTDSQNPALTYAKTQIALASRLAGLEPPHDSAYPKFDDLEGLRREALHSRSMGFVGKHAIHPRQLETIEAVYRPSKQEIERASRLIREFREAESRGEGAIGVNGELVDYPILYRAEQILAEAKA